MNTQFNARRAGFLLSLALLAVTVTGMGFWLLSQPGHAAHAAPQSPAAHSSAAPVAAHSPHDRGTQAGAGVLAAHGLDRPASQAISSTYTLACFDHPHFAGDPPVLVGEHLAQYRVNWQVSDASSVQFNLVTGIDCAAAGSITLTVEGAAAGAEGFSTYICAMSHTQACTLNIPVAGGGSVNGIPGQPTFTVPADQTAVLNIVGEVLFLTIP